MTFQGTAPLQSHLVVFDSHTSWPHIELHLASPIRIHLHPNFIRLSARSVLLRDQPGGCTLDRADMLFPGDRRRPDKAIQEKSPRRVPLHLRCCDLLSNEKETIHYSHVLSESGRVNVPHRWIFYNTACSSPFTRSMSTSNITPLP